MQAIDKLKTDMDSWARRAGPTPTDRDLDALASLISRAAGPIPRETVSAALGAFLEKRASAGPRGGAAALDWLACVASLFMMDYDGTPLTDAEWAEVKELATVDAGEIDLEVLSYVLSQVLEHVEI